MTDPEAAADLLERLRLAREEPDEVGAAPAPAPAPASRPPEEKIDWAVEMWAQAQKGCDDALKAAITASKADADWEVVEDLDERERAQAEKLSKQVQIAAARFEMKRLASVDSSFDVYPSLSAASMHRIKKDLQGCAAIREVGPTQFQLEMGEWRFWFAMQPNYPMAPPHLRIQRVDTTNPNGWVPGNGFFDWTPAYGMEQVALVCMVNIEEQCREYLRQSNEIFDAAIEEMDPTKSEQMFRVSQSLESMIETLLPDLLKK